MRTTVDIPDPIYRELKTKAAAEGRPIKELILRGVEAELDVAPRKQRRRIALPVVRSRRPGSLRLDNASIFESIPFP